MQYRAGFAPSVLSFCGHPSQGITFRMGALSPQAGALCPAPRSSSCILKKMRGRTPGTSANEIGMPSMHYITQFLLSALDAAQFPVPTVPEIAFLGRSNVGKSSLLNALVGEKAAKVSQTPGRTRAINFFALLDPHQQSKLIFADLPGYGYAKISKSISAGWPAFIEQIGRA